MGSRPNNEPAAAAKLPKKYSHIQILFSDNKSGAAAGVQHQIIVYMKAGNGIDISTGAN